MRKLLRPSRVWLILAILYGAFFYWYTSFGGPLTPEEVDRYVALMERGNWSPEDITVVREFLGADTGDDFVMVNVIEFNDQPARIEGAPRGATASDLMNLYMEHMWPALLARACHPVLVGQAASLALDIWGLDGAERWSEAGLIRYRSRRDLIQIALNPEFAGRHEFKLGAIAKTVAFPIDPWFQLGDPRLVLALVFLVLGFASQSFYHER